MGFTEEGMSPTRTILSSLGEEAKSCVQRHNWNKGKTEGGATKKTRATVEDKRRFGKTSRTMGSVIEIRRQRGKKTAETSPPGGNLFQVEVNKVK